MKFDKFIDGAVDVYADFIIMWHRSATIIFMSQTIKKFLETFCVYAKKTAYSMVNHMQAGKKEN